MKKQGTWGSPEDWSEAGYFGSPVLHNIPSFDFLQFEYDAMMIFRAGGSFGGDNWHLYIGRDDTEWGWARSGGLFVDDHLDYSDQARFVIWSDTIKYAAYLENFDDPWTEPTDQDEGGRAPVIYNAVIGHRFEYRILPTLSLNITEGVKIRTEGRYLDPRYFNPVMWMHNFFYFPNDNNNMLSIGFDFGFPGGIALSTEILVDQFANGNEGQWPPDAYGFMVMAEKAFFIKNGWMDIQLESFYTTPYLYLRETIEVENPANTGLDWLVDTARYAGGYWEERVYGYRLGPDLFAAFLFVNFDDLENLSWGTEVSCRIKGEKGIGPGENIEFNSEEQVDPFLLSGNLDYVLGLGLYADWSPVDWLNLFGRFDYFRHTAYSHVVDNQQTDLQMSIGVSIQKQIGGL